RDECPGAAPPPGHGRGTGAAHAAETRRQCLRRPALPPALETGAAMRAVSRTEWEVLNATADDWENLEQIYQAVRLWLGPNGTGLRGVADAVRRLAEDGLLEARLEEGEGSPDLRDLSYVWR